MNPPLDININGLFNTLNKGELYEGLSILIKSSKEPPVPC